MSMIVASLVKLSGDPEGTTAQMYVSCGTTASIVGPSEPSPGSGSLGSL